MGYNTRFLTAVLVAGFATALPTVTSAQPQSTPGAAASCQLSHSAGVEERRLTTGGRERTYRLFVPSGYDGRTRLPLVLNLHPSGGNSAGQARTSGFEEVAQREGFAVASPQAENGRWNVPVQAARADDVAYVSAVIDDVASQLCIDPARVYATGFSGGARMSSLLACTLNNRIAAIAPVAGLRWPAPCKGRAVPILTLHGLADTQNPYDGNAQGRGEEWLESVPDAMAGWARHNGCRLEAITEDPDGPLSTIRYAGCRDNADVRLIRIDGLGHAWTRQAIDSTEEIWRFFKNQRLQ
jgi:polyhydroxybutyrate depolymerase